MAGNYQGLHKWLNSDGGCLTFLYEFGISGFHRSDDTDTAHSYFGRKYIGVGTGGTLEMHGEKKLTWTFLNRTLHPGETNETNYYFERGWGNRGIIVHVIDPTTGDVLHFDRFVKQEDDSSLDKEETCPRDHRSVRTVLNLFDLMTVQV